MPLVAGQCEVVRDRAVAINASGERAIRTAGWFLRATADSQQLFLKPDDRYEVNEVADRCPEVVAELRAALDDFQQVAESPAALPRPLAPLADVLIESVA